jgi:hypothetical protein
LDGATGSVHLFHLMLVLEFGIEISNQGIVDKKRNELAALLQ